VILVHVSWVGSRTKQNKKKNKTKKELIDQDGNTENRKQKNKNKKCNAKSVYEKRKKKY
jgi:hypothetical protein